jgi:hypothetical protein
MWCVVFLCGTHPFGVLVVLFVYDVWVCSFVMWVMGFMGSRIEDMVWEISYWGSPMWANRYRFVTYVNYQQDRVLHIPIMRSRIEPRFR